MNQAEEGIRSLMFSREMQKQPLMERFISIETGIPLTPNIRMGQLTKTELETISLTLKRIKEYPVFLDTNYSGSLDYVENTVRKYKRLYGIDVVYIDYLQLLAERDENSTQELGRIMRRAKILSLELDIVFAIASQLNRNVELRDNKRPILSDFRQSGNIEEDADLAVGLYRDEYYNQNSKSKGTMEFIINKHRNGPVGIIPLTFKAETNKIEGK
jgi:replicative DNA helicase